MARLIIVYTPPTTSDIPAADKAVARAVRKAASGSGCFVAGPPERDLEFPFRTVADARAALRRVKKLKFPTIVSSEVTA